MTQGWSGADETTIHIQDLALRTIIGFKSWERDKKQDVVINVWITYDCRAAIDSDNHDQAVDYKKAKRRIIELVENSSFNLLEKLAHEILAICMSENRVSQARVVLDKPHALRFAKSVSVEMNGRRTQ